MFITCPCTSPETPPEVLGSCAREGLTSTTVKSRGTVFGIFSSAEIFCTNYVICTKF